MTNLDKLLTNASAPLSEHTPELSEKLCILAGSLVDDLLQVYIKCNGFYALEKALHFFPTHSDNQEISIEEWNDDNLWLWGYEGLADNCLFFAEDVFGGQFCISNNLIYIFDPETGSLEYLADSIENWANAIINDYETLTGYLLAHEWQEQGGKIPIKKRLIPKIPFVAGGEFVLGNLYLGDVIEAMKFRAYLANQIRELPDGTQIEFDIDDSKKA